MQPQKLRGQNGQQQCCMKLTVLVLTIENDHFPSVMFNKLKFSSILRHRLFPNVEEWITGKKLFYIYIYTVYIYMYRIYISYVLRNCAKFVYCTAFTNFFTVMLK